MTFRSWMRLAVVSVLGFGAVPAHAVCDATKLCEPHEDPCVVSATCTIPAGATFDVRPRALIVRRPLVVGTGTALTTILADSILVEPEGDVTANGTSGGGSLGGSFRLEATTTIVTRSQGNTRSRLRADAGLNGGSITLVAGGDVDLASTVSVAASNNLGYGGTIEVFSATGSIRIADTGGGTTIKATGGSSTDASGGVVDLFADQSVWIDGEIDASNGNSLAEINVEATHGTITTTSRGRLKVNASGLGDGGFVELAAGGAVTLAGIIEAKAAGSGNGENAEGGYGGVVVVSGAGVTLSASTIDLRGASPDGDGGELAVEALGDLTVDALVRVSVGGYGAGGEVSLYAEGDVDLRKRIDANGGDAGGGIAVAAGGDVTVRDQLLARGDWEGGAIELQGCAVAVLAGALVSTTASVSPRGQNLLTASGQLTVAGTLSAAGSNVLDHRELPPIITGSVVPAPVLRVVPGLPCCGDCPASTTSTSTSTSSTTSTSVTSSTSSSSSTTSSSASSSTSSSTSTTSTSTTSTTATSTSSSSTSSSTTTSAPSTSVTSSSSTSSAPSTAPTSTSTSTSSSVTLPPAGTTSTTVPAECPAVAPASVAGAACRIELVAGELAARTEGALGGRRQKRKLVARIAGAAKQVAAAERAAGAGKGARKVVVRLRRAARVLASFETRVTKGVGRGAIAAGDGARWLALARAARAELEVARANAPRR